MPQNRRILFGLVATTAAVGVRRMLLASTSDESLTFIQNNSARNSRHLLSVVPGQFSDPKTVNIRGTVEDNPSSAEVDTKLVHLGIGDTKVEPFYAPVEEAHAFKCCTHEPANRGGSGKWLQRPRGATWCPLSYNMIEEEECNLLTFQKANDFCASKGGRLCTADELKGGCAKGNACGFDLQFVWTAELRTVYRGNGGVSAIPRTWGEHFDAVTHEVHGVKCCSDDGERPGWLKHTEYAPHPDRCPFSYKMAEEECKLLTFKEATSFCAAKGGRICSVNDILARCTIGNGCGFDNEYVWTIDLNIIHLGRPGPGRLGGNFAAPAHEERGAKCCTEQEAGLGWSKKPQGEAWCPLSYNQVGEECNYMTHPVAKEFCASKGGRLCTPFELQSGCAVSTGCNFDSEQVWTHTSEVRGHPLIHVFSPYYNPSAKLFAPLTMEQWAMLVSAKTERDRFNQEYLANTNPNAVFDSVVLVCAVLKKDFDGMKASLAPYCDIIKALPRSTKSEHPDLEMKDLPYLQDVIDAGRSVVKDRQDFHLMYTNSDIAPTENFYQFVERRLRYKNRHTEPLIVNRMTMNTKDMALPTNTDGPFRVKHVLATNLVEQVKYAVKRGEWERHPGHDCFIAHSSIWKSMTFGDLFLGCPPWSGIAVYAFYVMGNLDSKNIIASNEHGTFHLDDSRTWHHVDMTRYSLLKQFSDADLEMVTRCPIILKEPKNTESVLSAINCGKLFMPREEGSEVPKLVQPGYEKNYLKNYMEYKSMRDYTLRRKQGWIRHFIKN